MPGPMTVWAGVAIMARSIGSRSAKIFSPRSRRIEGGASNQLLASRCHREKRGGVVVLESKELGGKRFELVA